jgi:hypothetical protein
MVTRENTALKDLPALRDWVAKLLALAARALDGARFSDEDHLGFMAFCFLCKQFDHLQSVVALFPGRDATLIARSMLEGLCQLVWAAKEPKTRPLQWRAFVLVHDWRLMQEKLARGERVAPERQRAITDRLSEPQHRVFLTTRARKAMEGGGPMPADPYHKDWRCGKQLKDIFEAVGGEDLHCGPYDSYSEWHHWDVSGFGGGIHRVGSRIVYLPRVASDSASSLACGFQCLVQTLDIVNSHFNLCLSSEIGALRDAYVAWGTARRENRAAG